MSVNRLLPSQEKATFCLTVVTYMKPVFTALKMWMCLLIQKLHEHHCADNMLSQLMRLAHILTSPLPTLLAYWCYVLLYT
jgi:hypothetical protein